MPVVKINIADDADFIWGFTYKVGGVAYDFTGATLEMGIRRRATDKTAVLDLTMDDGISFEDAPNGKFVIFISKERLEIIPPGDYVHSLIQTRPDAKRLPVWTGTLNLSKGPTR